jgi:hypothetical protein
VDLAEQGIDLSPRGGGRAAIGESLELCGGSGALGGRMRLEHALDQLGGVGISGGEPLARVERGALVAVDGEHGDDRVEHRRVAEDLELLADQLDDSTAEAWIGGRGAQGGEPFAKRGRALLGVAAGQPLEQCASGPPPLGIAHIDIAGVAGTAGVEGTGVVGIASVAGLAGVVGFASFAGFVVGVEDLTGTAGIVGRARVTGPGGVAGIASFASFAGFVVGVLGGDRGEPGGVERLVAARRGGLRAGECRVG